MLRKGKGTNFHVLLFDCRLLLHDGHTESRGTENFSFAPLNVNSREYPPVVTFREEIFITNYVNNGSSTVSFFFITKASPHAFGFEHKHGDDWSKRAIQSYI